LLQSSHFPIGPKAEHAFTELKMIWVKPA